MKPTLVCAALLLTAPWVGAAPRGNKAAVAKKAPGPPPAVKPPPPPPPVEAASAPPPPPTPPRNGAGAAAPSSRKTADPAAEGAEAARRAGPTRVDFDDRLVQGQSTKQGAIYLFERKENPLRSMLKKRENFRAELAGSIE